VLDSVHLAQVLEDLFRRDFPDAVWIDGLRREIFGERNGRRAVARHRRAEDDALHARGDCRGEDARRRGDDVLRHEVRRKYARAFISGRGRVIDDAHAFREREHSLEVVAVGAMELDAGRNVVLVAADEVVATDDVVPLRLQMAREVAPEKSGHAGDEDPSRHPHDGNTARW
jgi:hypothetical protein